MVKSNTRITDATPRMSLWESGVKHIEEAEVEVLEGSNEEDEICDNRDSVNFFMRTGLSLICSDPCPASVVWRGF